MSPGAIAALSLLAFPPRALRLREMAPCPGLIPWGDRVVVASDPPRVFDISSERFELLGLPEDPTLLGLAEYAGRSFFLCASTCGDSRLLERSGDTWQEHELPYARRIGDVTATAIAADGSALVLLVSPWLYRFEAGEWAVVGVRRIAHEREDVLAPCPRHALLMGRRLFLGYDDGEWGGDLVALDIDTGELVELEGMARSADMPVHGLTLDPRGRLWTARGLSHLGLAEGGLYRLDGDRWSTIAWNQGFYPVDAEAEMQPAGDWGLPPTSFDAVVFDRAGGAYLVTDYLGVLRQTSEGGWVRVTPGWPEYAYVQGAVLHGRSLIVALGGTGLTLVDIADGSMRRADPR
jgi:hypothetical protein